MKDNCRVKIKPLELLLLLVLMVCTFFVYTGSIKGPFVFDDAVNIRTNYQITLNKLSWDGIVSAAFKSPCHNRPVANISFALNYYFNRYDVAGYHLVNILLHIITGIILFYLIKITLGLLSAQNLKFCFNTNILPDKPNDATFNAANLSISTSPYPFAPASKEILYISFFTAFIWLVHPIQTQTVSYIVQRMNCMAAMFYILSLFIYIKARLANSKLKKLVLFTACILSGALSLGSKEIATTLPFFIFLYEWYFFQDLNLKWLKRNSIYLLCALFVIGFIALIFLGGHPIKNILSGYRHRDFTMWQRVLTEFRVVIYYISLIIFPHPTRLNLLHDFPISHSFIHPITTLMSFIAILGLIVTAMLIAKKERLLSFCILWFLGNLVIESSILGAEIIFEHRVYMPSMFFIMILVVSMHRFINHRWLGGVLLCAMVIILSGWTYQRNLVWNENLKLWEDVVKKSPDKARAQNNLGDALRKRGRIDEAKNHFLKALQIDYDYVEAHNNLGVVLALNRNFDDAIKHYRTAIKTRPRYVDAYYNLGNALNQKGDVEAAIHCYQKVLKLNPGFFQAYYNIARILSNQGRIGEAIYNFQKVLTINDEIPQALFNLAWIYGTSENEKYRNGVIAVKLAEKLCALTGYQQPLALDALAAAYAANGNFDKAVETAKKGVMLANKLGPKELTFGLRKRLKLYQSGRPYREPLKQKKIRDDNAK